MQTCPTLIHKCLCISKLLPGRSGPKKIKTITPQKDTWFSQLSDLVSCCAELSVFSFFSSLPLGWYSGWKSGSFANILRWRIPAGSVGCEYRASPPFPHCFMKANSLLRGSPVRMASDAWGMGWQAKWREPSNLWSVLIRVLERKEPVGEEREIIRIGSCSVGGWEISWSSICKLEFQESQNEHLQEF